MIQLIYSHRHALGSYLIRLGSPDWSHVGIIDGDHVIEAVWPSVQRRHLMDVLPHYADYAIVEYDALDSEAALRFAHAQVGKRYDAMGLAWQLFGRVAAWFGIERDWQHPGQWFCNELAEATLREAGAGLIRPGCNLFGPGDMWRNPAGRVITGGGNG